MRALLQGECGGFPTFASLRCGCCYCMRYKGGTERMRKGKIPKNTKTNTRNSCCKNLTHIPKARATIQCGAVPECQNGPHCDFVPSETLEMCTEKRNGLPCLSANLPLLARPHENIHRKQQQNGVQSTHLGKMHALAKSTSAIISWRLLQSCDRNRSWG